MDLNSLRKHFRPTFYQNPNIVTNPLQYRLSSVNNASGLVSSGEETDKVDIATKIELRKKKVTYSYPSKVSMCCQDSKQKINVRIIVKLLLNEVHSNYCKRVCLFFMQKFRLTVLTF